MDNEASVLTRAPFVIPQPDLQRQVLAVLHAARGRNEPALLLAPSGHGKSSDGALLATGATCGGGAPLAWCAATAGGRLLTSGADKQLKAWTLPDLVLEASFAANGAFGSADGVGGEGALSAADGRVAVGDGSGRLYALELVGV